MRARGLRRDAAVFKVECLKVKGAAQLHIIEALPATHSNPLLCFLPHSCRLPSLSLALPHQLCVLTCVLMCPYMCPYFMRSMPQYGATALTPRACTRDRATVMRVAIRDVRRSRSSKAACNPRTSSSSPLPFESNSAFSSADAVACAVAVCRIHTHASIHMCIHTYIDTTYIDTYIYTSMYMYTMI